LVFLYGSRKYQHSSITAYSGPRVWTFRADLICDSEPIRQRARPYEPQIGDIGFISQDDGAFYRLFNARMPRDHPWNAGRVPDKFIPITLDDDHMGEVAEILKSGAYLYASHTDKRLDAQSELCVASWYLSLLVASLNSNCIETTHYLL
jgi:hypothetical protein